MAKVEIWNWKRERVGEAELPAEVFEYPYRRHLVWEVVKAHLAGQRRGTHKTKTRSEVSGTGKKPFRQKGTGNARTGGIRNPIKKGGGHAKQKRPKDWRQALPKKARRAARNSALLSKFQSGDVRIIDSIKLDGPKTKPVAQMFKALGIDRSVLVAINGRNENVEKSARNIDRTTLYRLMEKHGLQRDDRGE